MGLNWRRLVIRIVKAFVWLFLLASGFAIVYGFGRAAMAFPALIGALDPAVASALLGAVATVFVGLAGVLYTQTKIKQREIDNSHRSRKVEIYKKFLSMVARVLAQGAEIEGIAPLEEGELARYMIEFKSDVILWGSAPVVKAALEFSRAGHSTEHMAVVVENLYRAIREDIGLSNSGLARGDLFKMYLKNPDELDRLISEKR